MIAVLSVEVLPPDTPISLNPTIEFGGKFGILKISRVPLVILLVFKSGMRAGDNSPLVILLALMFGINVKLNAPLLMSILSLAKESTAIMEFPITGISAGANDPLVMSIFPLSIEALSIKEFPITGSRAVLNVPLVILEVGKSGIDVSAMF
jgi:hypothetical protein